MSATPVALAHHGVTQLASVEVDAYNAELRDAEGFVGDRASKRAFQAILESWRTRLRDVGEDPLGDTPTDEVGKKQLDKMLSEGGVEAAGLVHSAVEEFAQELAAVIRKFLRLEGWRETQRIAVGGGLRASRVGELAISRAAVLLRADSGHNVELRPIRHHPDEAGLVGSVHLAPAWALADYDGILAVDIGGTNIRAGLVELNRKKADDFSAAHVAGLKLWRHRDDCTDREGVVDWIVDVLRDLARRAKKDKMRLASFIGIGCPGLIRDDGSIAMGGQNLPGGNWEEGEFNLPRRIREEIPEIAGHETFVAMHNDAVVQGLSEVPCMQDVEHWGILTIGTGLGNAHFTNRSASDASR